jgi:hypothetical protein
VPARLTTIVLLAAALPLNVAAVRDLRGRRAVLPLARATGLDLLAPPPTTTTTVVLLEPGAPAAAVPGSPPPLPASCPASAVTVSVVTNQPSYLLGQAVVATTTVVNRSALTCAWPGTLSFTWTDAYGDSVQDGTTDPEPASVRWAPGQMRTDTETWDQVVAYGATAAPGLATVSVVWTDGGGGTYSGQATFTIVDPATTIPP